MYIDIELDRFHCVKTNIQFFFSFFFLFEFIQSIINAVPVCTTY